MQFTFITVLIVLFATIVAATNYASMCLGGRYEYLVAFNDDIPDEYYNNAKVAVTEAAASIEHEFNIFKGFSGWAGYGDLVDVKKNFSDYGAAWEGINGFMPFNISDGCPGAIRIQQWRALRDQELR